MARRVRRVRRVHGRVFELLRRVRVQERAVCARAAAGDPERIRIYPRAGARRGGRGSAGAGGRGGGAGDTEGEV